MYKFKKTKVGYKVGYSKKKKPCKRLACVVFVGALQGTSALYVN